MGILDDGCLCLSSQKEDDVIAVQGLGDAPPRLYFQGVPVAARWAQHEDTPLNRLWTTSTLRPAKVTKFNVMVDGRFLIWRNKHYN